MKYLIFILAIAVMLLVSCEKEQPTNFSATYDKYQIQNDSDWVEITDIDTLNSCLGPAYWIRENNKYIIIKNENEYKTIFDDAVATLGKDFIIAKCDTVYKPTGVDFSKRFIISYKIATGDVKFTRKIFKNKISKDYFYLVSITNFSSNEILRGWGESISLPIINSDINVVFDTLHTNF